MKGFLTKCVNFFSGYFSQLLTSLVLLFIFRPYQHGHLYLVIWQILFLIVFLSAIFNCNHSKKTKFIAVSLGLPALITQWINLFNPSQTLTITFLVLTICFIFITTESIIRRVVINARVKVETLRGVICAYLMVAFGFSFIYFLIETLIPGSFRISEVQGVILTHSHLLAEMIYFSFVTLLCIGYGDVLAVHDTAQTFSIMEGIIGQFYIAILVARLVSVYSFFEHKLHLVSQKKKGKE